MRYQPTWINGEETETEYQRSCADRYEPIKELLDLYERPFTVLDLGANMGWFSFNIASDYGATCIMVDQKKELPKLCEVNEVPVIHLNTHLTGGQIRKLSHCEHFDVVLALNVLHYLKDWPLAIKGLFNLADHVIIETPVPSDPPTTVSGPDEYTAILGVLSSKRYQLMGEFRHKGRHTRPMMYFNPGAKKLSRQTIDTEERNAPPVEGITLSSDFKNKKVRIQRRGTSEIRDWVHGMNLWNWKLLRGSWPEIQMVKKRMVKAVNRLGHTHDDLVPWNFVLDAERVHCIDHNNKKRLMPGRDIEQCLDMLSRPSQWSAGSGVTDTP